MKKQILRSAFLLLLTVIPICGYAQVDIDDDSDSSLVYITPEVGIYDLSCITPPSGFTVSDQFNGYINKNTSSTILVQLITGLNYINLAAGINSQHWASQQLTEVSRQDFSTESGMSGILFKLSFSVSETPMFRYMYITGDLSRTVWINATYPAQFDELISPFILSSLRTVHLID
jgi:hypothetical protein